LTIGIEKLTSAFPSWKARDSSLFLIKPPLRKHCVCFCGYGKNYRLQDIQLKKNLVNLRG
jgi:hypothetical protein